MNYEIVEKSAHPYLRRQPKRWMVRIGGEWVLDLPRGNWIREFKSAEEAEQFAKGRCDVPSHGSSKP